VRLPRGRPGGRTAEAIAGNRPPRHRSRCARPGRIHQGLRDFGYTEGSNILIESRWAEGNPERFPALAAELVALKVNVIKSAGGTLGALAAKQATTNIAPGASLVALLLKPDSMSDSAREIFLKEANLSAGKLPVVEARGPADFDSAFSELAAKGAGALVVLNTAAFVIERKRLVDLSAKIRLPTAYTTRSYVDSGGLMSYGPNFADLNRRAASYVDKILKGEAR
jgi:putative ABC transport system substrate-binding protein